jgi:hypothetical protein
VTLDLAIALRSALIGQSAIADDLALFNGEPAIFTRRPLPDKAPYPLCMINPAAAIGDQDYLNSALPIVMRDVAFYGEQPKDYRLIERLSYLARDFFHRNKWAIVPDGYDVIQITAKGPIPGATDDQTTVGRLVSLTIQLRRQ